MTVVELKRFSELAAASTKNVPAISAFFMISYDAYDPVPTIAMLHVKAYKPLTGAVNSPEYLLYPLPAFVFTTSNTSVWCLLGLTSSQGHYGFHSFPVVD